MHILIRISLILKAGVAKNPVLELMNGVYVQLDGERFNVLFNSVSVISERCEGKNERLNALEHRLRLEAPVAQWVKR